MIHILDYETGEIKGWFTDEDVLDDQHKKSLENTLETYEFITSGDHKYAEYLAGKNRIIIPDEDGSLIEFEIAEAIKQKSNTHEIRVLSRASYLNLKTAKVIRPTRLEGYTPSTIAGWTLDDTGWSVGVVESNATRTFDIENPTKPYDLLKRIANEFGLELRFRVEHDGNKITGRYVDLLERVGKWRGREVEFGTDLDRIKRTEKTDNIVTALVGLGPEQEDGTRLEVIVKDEEALQRWGRRENGELKHLWDYYEPQSTRIDMTLEELEQYTRTELNKRINEVVTYEANIIDLENVPGLENKKIRFGDTIKIKDTKFNPPLYLEARVFEQERSVFRKSRKKVKLGDYIEYTEEEVQAIWKQLQSEIRQKIELQELIDYTYDKLTIDGKDEDLRTDVESYANSVSNQAKDEAITYTNNTVDPIVVSVDNLEVDVSNLDTEMNQAQTDILQAQTDIIQAFDEISLNASELSLIEGRMNDTEAEISVMSDQISSKVDATYVDGVIADIEVGGTNILQGSNFNLDTMRGWGTAMEVNYFQDFYSYYRVNCLDETANNFGLQTKPDFHTTHYVNGKEYTLSFEARGNVTDFNYTYMMRSDGDNQSIFSIDEVILDSTEWTKVTVTATSPFTTDQGYILIGSTDSDSGKWFEIRKLQIEEGNKATTWSPAPEDIQGQIDDLDVTVSNHSSSITQLSTEIESKVESSVFDVLEGRVTDAESTITQHSNEIALKVDEDGVISAINLSSESTTIQSSKINLVGAVTVLSDITDDLGDIYAGNIYGAYIEGGEIVQNAGSGHTSIHLNDKGLIVRDGEGDDRLAIVTDEYEFQGANPSTIYFEPNTSEEFILGTFHEGLGEAFLGFVDQQPDYYFNIRNWGGTIGLDARTTSVTKQSGWEEHFLLRRYDTYNAVWDMNLANGNLNFEYRGEYGGSRDRYFTISKTGNVYVGQGIGHVVAGYIDFTQSGNSAGYLGVSSRLRVTDGDFWQGSNTTVYQPVNASSFNESSLEELKQDIELLTINALEIIVDADLYSFKRIDEVERGMNYTRYGFVIGEDKKTPVEVLDDEGEAINHGNVSAILWKGQQEIITHIYNHDERINDLEIENQLLKERVRQLEEAS